MQPSLRSLVPFTFVAFARASPFEARSGSSSISVPVADGFTALASQARPGSELAGSKINGGGTTGAVTHAGAQLHNLTANAAQFDVYFYVCNGQNCQGGCEYFHLNNYAANVCYTVNSFPFLSGFIQDANTPLPYGVFVSPFTDCSQPTQLGQVQTCYNFAYNGVPTDFAAFYISYNG